MKVDKETLKRWENEQYKKLDEWHAEWKAKRDKRLGPLRKANRILGSTYYYNQSEDDENKFRNADVIRRAILSSCRRRTRLLESTKDKMDESVYLIMGILDAVKK